MENYNYSVALTVCLCIRVAMCMSYYSYILIIKSLINFFYPAGLSIIIS